MIRLRSPTVKLLAMLTGFGGAARVHGQHRRLLGAGRAFLLEQPADFKGAGGELRRPGDTRRSANTLADGIASATMEIVHQLVVDETNSTVLTSNIAGDLNDIAGRIRWRTVTAARFRY